MVIYTLGYEKKSIEEYIDILKANSIKLVIDVRERAWSHKKDFCKARFAKLLSLEGIKYLNVKELGNPKLFRDGIPDRNVSLELYKEYLLSTRSGLDVLENILDTEEENFCLTCFEKEPNECHRSIILDVLGQEKNFYIINL